MIARRRPRIALLLAAAGGTVAACAAPGRGPRDGVEERFNFWPLARYETAESPAGSDLEVLWPLARFTRSGDAVHRRVFPLFWFDDDGHGERVTNVLGLFHRRRDEARERSEFHLYPLLHVVRSPETRNTHVWPLWGVARTGLGSDNPGRSDCFAWPLFEVARVQDGTSRSFRMMGMPGLFALARGRRAQIEDDHDRILEQDEFAFADLLGGLVSVFHSSSADQPRRLVIEPPSPPAAPVPPPATAEPPPLEHVREHRLIGLGGLFALEDFEESAERTRTRLLALTPIDWLALGSWIERRDAGGATESSHGHLVPFYAASGDAQGRERRWFAGPLLGLEKDPTRDLSGVDVLFPLFRFASERAGDGRAWHVRALPFAWFTRRPDASASVLFPFYWRFTTAPAADGSSEGSDYLHVVPFFGRHVENGGDFRRTFVVPPLWIRTSDRRTGLLRTDVLYPLGRFESSLQGALNRFFPLFFRRVEGARVHTNVLGVFDRDVSEVRDRWMLYPLRSRDRAYGEGDRWSWLPLLDARYALDRAPDGSETSVLFPLASFRRDGFEHTRWIFPVYWDHDDGVLTSWFHVWPLYGVNRRGAYVQRSFLHPLFFAGSDDDGTERRTGFLFPLAGSRRDVTGRSRWIAWLFHDTVTVESAPALEAGDGDDGAVERVDRFTTGDARRTNVLWPLYHRERDADGARSWHVLFLLARGEQAAPADGGADEFALLGALYRSRVEGLRATRSVPFLFSFEREGAGASAQRTLKLFHLIPIRW